jgi:F-type H+-transporting ATPase subunit b
MSKTLRTCFAAAVLLLLPLLLWSQSAPQPAASSASAPSVSVPAQTTPEAEAAKAVEAPKAAKGASKVAEEEEENAEFKYSGIVLKVAKATGLSKEAIYWIFMIINFAILASGLGWVVKKVMPQGFAPRTAQIQKGIEEARKASAEASARLSEIEERLSHLGEEIAALKATSEADFSVEEQRIKAAAEEDARNIVVAAEQEIAAAARVAQRDLKSFAAGLAVDLAEQKIKVDDATDKALVTGFATQLGKDGK